MERIKQALEMARRERQNRQGVSPVPVSTPVTSRDTAEITYGQTQSITLDEAVLRNNRLITGLGPCPFSESYNLLRT